MLENTMNDFVNALNKTHANRFTERLFGYVCASIGLLMIFIGSDYIKCPREELYIPIKPQIKEEVPNQTQESEEQQNG